jgi:hypothetical protein
MNARRILPGLAVVAALTACGAQGDPYYDNSPPVYTPVSTSAALAYVKAHPAAPRPGMTAGVVLNVDVTDAGVITVTIVTAAGQDASAVCGTSDGGCGVTDAGKIANEPGSYVYLPSDGLITRTSDLQNIHIAAVRGGWS